MLKTISAAFVAISILAAPAMAATVIKTEKAPVTKSVTVKPSVANAQARFVKKHPHHRHYKHIRHHRAHKHLGAVVTKKPIMKHMSSATPAVKHVIVKKKA
ncbi:MAG TPA: hypothetical protein VF467_14445 [Afipia sp.]